MTPNLTVRKSLTTARQRSNSRVSGQSTVEFALVAAVFLVLTLGILELGRAFYAHSAITNAVREGARMAIVDPGNEAAIRTTVVSSAVAVGLTEEDVAVSEPSGGTWEVGSPITVTVTYNYAPIVEGIVPDLSMGASSVMIIESIPSVAHP